MSRTAIFLLALSLAAPAFAQAPEPPPPMSEEKLMSESDLVALLRIEEVTAIGATVEMPVMKPLMAYQAKAEVVEVKKGDAKPGDTVTIEFNEIPEGVMTAYSAVYYPGEEVWTHLRTRGPNYRNTWWNTRGKLVTPSPIRQLPQAPGQTVTAPAEVE